MISRLFDFFRGIFSLAVVLGLLIGIPILLLVIVGYPLPTERPSMELIRAHLDAGDIPDEFIIKTLALVVWVVWAQLAVAIVTESVAMVLGRVAGRAPVLPGLQLMAGKLVATSVLMVSAFLPSRAAIAAPLVPITATDMPMDAGIGAPPAGLGGSSGPFAQLSRNGLTGTVDGGNGAGATAAASIADGRYQTRSGDSWWDMAERLLGDGMRWGELRDLNSGRTMLTGDVISEETVDVREGWELAVPADADADLLVTGQDPTAEVSSQSVAISDEHTIGRDTGKTDSQQPDPMESDTVESDPMEPGTMEPETDEAGADEAGADEVALPPADDQGSDGGGATTGGVEVPSSSPLIDAIKPFSLVYEGPTEADVPGRSVPYQVVAGDNLWNIAARHLGDPFRWPEIFENSTGLDQTFGRTITDPNLIWPDSVLLLPADATDVPQPDAELVGEVLGALSQPTEGSADATGHQVDSDRAVKLRPQDLRQAVAAAEAGVSTGEPPSDPPDPGARSGGPEEGGDQQPDGFEELRHFFSTPPGMVFGAGGTMVATGLLGLLGRARRLRLTEAGPGTIPAPPPVALVDVETVLRNSSSVRESLSVHRIIASLADRPVVAGEPLAAPEVIRLGAERVEVIQNGQDPDLPSPWLAASNAAVDAIGGKSLAVLPAEFFPEDQEPVDGHDLAAPVCVTVGRGLLLNLESIGVTTISGSVEAVAGLVRSMVHELATGPTRRSLDIRISDRLPGADLHDHVRSGPLDGLADELEPWFQDVELGMTAAGGFSAYALRAAGDGRSIPGPKVIFADRQDAPALASVLSRARRQAMPLAVVFSTVAQGLPAPASRGSGFPTPMTPGSVGQVEPAVTVQIEGPITTVAPFGVVAATQHLETDLILGAEALVAQARQAPMVHRDDDQSTILPHTDHPTDPSQVQTEETPEHEIVTELPADEHEVTDRADDADSGILIRVLGPVEFDGGPEDLSEQERSILTFLALVGPSTSEQLRDAVWPDQDITEQRFDAVIEELAGKLGLLFPQAGDGRHRVRSVITDLGSARRWLVQAASMSDERARNLTELALSEIRGMPFDGVEPRYWQWVEDHRFAVSTQACSMLIDACFDLCDAAYGAGDLGVASWACDMAALIDPLHETVAIRRVQLLGVTERNDEAAQLVGQWEARYTLATDLTAPRGPRSALRPREVVSPHVS